MRFLPFFIIPTLLHAADPVDFNRDIRPFLSDTCFKCHGPDKNTREAGLRLDVEEAAKEDLGGYAAIVPGKPGESEAVHRILLPSDDIDHMPPADSGLVLTDEQKQLFQRWIAEGAEYKEHWSFTKIERPDVPAGKNAIDHFIRQKLDEKGLSPSFEAEKTTLIRRVTLDLTGLPPTPEEVNAFLADDSPEAYEKMVDRLLKSPRFGERMAWTWLEAARYADTDGYQNDGPRDMWRWRDWVIEAYNSGKSFDRFTIEQLAGDLLPDPDLDQLIATGFNRNNRYNSEAGIPLEEFLLENAVDRVDTTSTVWMGLTMGCARCHDHKYDPFSQKEYYQLIDYFNDVPESGRAIKFGNSEPWIKAPTPDQQEKLAALEQKVAQARKNLEKAGPQIDKAFKTWNPEPQTDAVLLSHGLDHHFPKPDHGQLKKIEGLICNGRFSIAFHMTPEEVKSGAVLSSETGDTTRKGILVEFVDGRLRYHIISRWIAGVATLETERTFKPGEKVHVMLTNDGTQRVDGMQIYLDGEPAATRALHNTNSNKSGRNHGGVMRVGQSKHVGNWKGQLTGLRFYTNDTFTEREARLLASPDSPEARRASFLEHAAPPELAKLATGLRQAEKALEKYRDSLPSVMVMVDSNPPNPSYVRDRGVYDQLGEQVQPGVPDVLPDVPKTAPNNRLGLAKWLVSDEHPLTARVTVNRYWQMLFGQGLVRTPEDFGAQGQLPSHPELLDWLAAEFMESGWDIKHILKTIVTSQTYRQSSRTTPELLEKDPENILLARAPRKRLPGNVLRDQALFVGDLLIEKRGGPSVKPYQPANLWREASNFSYKADKGDNLYRRSLYTYWKRTLAPPSMALLDTADREWCSVRPRQTNTPLQALTLLNETAFFEAARKFGERILAEGGKTDAERVKFAFQTVAARQPTQKELNLLTEAYATYRENFTSNPKSAQQALKTGESKVDPNHDPVELAATSALANVLLNLDEVTTRE